MMQEIIYNFFIYNYLTAYNISYELKSFAECSNRFHLFYK